MHADDAPVRGRHGAKRADPINVCATCGRPSWMGQKTCPGCNVFKTVGHTGFCGACTAKGRAHPYIPVPNRSVTR